MSKTSKPSKVEIQKGPIRMEEQYTEKFCRGSERTTRDMENLRMRQDKMTMTLHTPKH
jgi:hypothetical protein